MKASAIPQALFRAASLTQTYLSTLDGVTGCEKNEVMSLGKFAITAVIVLTVVTGAVFALLAAANFTAYTPQPLEIPEAEILPPPRDGSCGDDAPPRDIPSTLNEKSKMPADAVIAQMPSAIQNFGDGVKEEIENGSVAAVVRSFSEQVWDSEAEAMEAFNTFVLPTINWRATSFRDTSVSTLDGFLNQAGNASTGIFGHQFRTALGYKGPSVSKDLFSYREKDLNLNARINIQSVTYDGVKYNLDSAKFELGAEYILDAQNNGNKLSVVSSWYVRCQAAPWEQVNTASMKWESGLHLPYFRYEIPTLIKITLGKGEKAKVIRIKGAVELDPWNKSWEKSLTWRFGVKISSGGGNEESQP